VCVSQGILQMGSDIEGNETPDQLARRDPHVLSQDLNHHATIEQGLPRRLSEPGQTEITRNTRSP
jgi:hypothetical protein